MFSDSGSVLWKCNFCDKTSAHKRTLRCHIETHLSGFEQQCPHCDKKRKTREALRVHIYNDHKKKGHFDFGLY